MTLSAVIAATDYVDLLTHTCTVGRPTQTGTDDGNMPTYDWTTDQDLLVVCRPDPPAGRSSDTGLVSISGELVKADYRLYLLHAQDITVSSRVSAILDSDGVSVPGVFEVLGKPDDAGAQGHHKEMLIRAVN